MMQYVYIVCISREPYIYKVCLQEKDAIKHGRRLATKFLIEGFDAKVLLYRQSITRNGEVEFCKTLMPF